MTQLSSAPLDGLLRRPLSAGLPRGAAWLWLDVVACAVVGGLAHAGGSGRLDLAIAVWSMFLAIRLVARSPERALTAFWILFTAYTVSAWIAATAFDVRYAPFPSNEAIGSGTELSLQAVVAAFLLIRLINFGDRFDGFWRRSLEDVRHIVRQLSTGRLLAASFPLLAIAAVDWRRLAGIGVGNVLGGERRQYAAHLLSTSNHNVWVVGFASSVVLALHLVASGGGRRRSLWPGAILAIYWLPSVLVGSRQQLVACAAAVAIVAVGARERRTSRTASAILAVLLVVAFLLPWFQTHKFNQSTVEFVYPEYVLFSDIQSNLPLHYSYWEGAQFMLPRGLRFGHPVSVAQQVADLHISNVGIADHPVAEAYVVSPRHAVLLGASVTVAALLLVVLLARVTPAFLVVGVGHLAVWGRTEFWVFAFYVLYTGALVWLLLPRQRVAANPVEEPPASYPANRAQL